MGAAKDAMGTLDLKALGDRHFALNLSVHRRRSHFFGAVDDDQQSTTGTHCTFKTRKIIEASANKESAAAAF
jgi:hypothetical protein